MKVSKQKNKAVGLLIVAALATQMLASFAYGQDVLDSTVTDEADDVLAQPQIDVDGTLNKKTAADQLAEARKKMEKQHEEMVQKKIEDIRIREEAKLGKKLRSAFNNQPSDEVSTAAAAPMAPQKMEAPAPIPAPVEDDKVDFKIIPSFGVKNIAGDNLDLESKVNGQLALEAMVTSRISVGMSVGYMTLDMSDVSQTSYGTAYNYNYNTTYNPTYGYNNWYSNWYNTYSPTYGTGYNYNTTFYDQNYYNAFGNTGREMTYKQWSVEMNSKFFIVQSGRIRPYAGLGISYNRATLNYKSNTNAQGQAYTWNGFTLGDEQFRTSFVGGAVDLGSEIYFTKNFGLNVDVRYSRAISSGINNQSGSTFAYNPDQDKLERIGKAIEDSDSFALSGGILLAF